MQKTSKKYIWKEQLSIKILLLNKRNKLVVQYEQFPGIFSRTSHHHPPIWNLTRISSWCHDIFIEHPEQKDCKIFLTSCFRPKPKLISVLNSIKMQIIALLYAAYVRSESKNHRKEICQWLKKPVIVTLLVTYFLLQLGSNLVLSRDQPFIFRQPKIKDFISNYHK